MKHTHRCPACVERPDALVVEETGGWFRLPTGERFTIETRAPLRRVLLRLVQKRVAAPGAPVTLNELLDAGWPGEKPLPQAGANRVYVALSSLRSLGLKAFIRRTGEGWLLDKSLRVEWR